VNIDPRCELQRGFFFLVMIDDRAHGSGRARRFEGIAASDNHGRCSAKQEWIMNRRISIAVFAVAMLGAAPCAAAQSTPDRALEGVIVGQNGKTSTVNRVVTRDPGVRTAEISVTGPNGQVRTQENIATRDRVDGTSSTSRTTTFADGQTRSVNGTAVKTDNGADDLSRTVTGRAGETRTQTGTAQATKTETGRTVSGELNGPAGQSTFNRTVSHEDGVRTVDQNSTGPRGATASTSRVIDRKTGNFESNRTQTGPNGATRTTRTTGVRNGDTVTGQRTVTRPNGQGRSGSFSGRASRR
jgi:hypothetical protein